METQFIDTAFPVITGAQAQELTQHYTVVSFEKGTGGYPTEPHIYENAALIRAANPGTKIIFYLAVDTVYSSYAAYDVYIQHPEWWLKV